MSEKIELPAIVANWVKELNNPKNSDFQKDLYRQRLETLVGMIQSELAFTRKK